MNPVAELREDFVPEVSPVLEPETSSWPPVTDSVLEPAPEAPRSGALPSQVTRHLVGGTSALGLSVFVERGCGLLANILAARLGGTATFGAYSLAISQANNISTYAAGGIGATAARFSGKYPRSSEGYETLKRVLTIVSLTSAALAAIALWAGAVPIAHLLRKDALAPLLRWAAISSVGIILLECARGFFVGQRILRALLLMSLLVGVGMVTLLPFTAQQHHPQSMIVVQGAIAISAVLVCVVLGRRLGVHGTQSSAPPLPLLPVLREVWSFGAIQLAGLVGANLSGWWLTAVVARSDTSLVQISFLAIASQLRNVVSLAPSLLTEGSYAVMADPRHEQTQTPQRVMALCTYASLSVSLLLGLFGMLVLPWVLTLLYGHSYAGASAAIGFGLATAVAHMGNAPAAARLSIVSIRSTGVINTIWAIFVAAAATLLFLRSGSALAAMAIFFAAHVLSAAQVLFMLQRRDHLPRGMVALFGLAVASIGSAAVLNLLRVQLPSLHGVLTTSLALLCAASMLALFALGKHHEWLPPRAALQALLTRVRPYIAGRLRRV